jgi:hypothetical protein
MRERCMGKAASLDDVAVVADSGRAGEVAAGQAPVGREKCILTVPSSKLTVRPLVNSQEQEMVVFRRRKSVLLTPFSDAGCSKRPDFSPAQPWRAETRLFPNKAAANFHFIYKGWLG